MDCYYLHTTTLRRTAAVVWKRCDVDNLSNLNTSTMNGTDCALTTVARTLDEGFHLAETKTIGHLCTILCSHLSGIRSVLFRTTETHLTSR